MNDRYGGFAYLDTQDFTPLTLDESEFLRSVRHGVAFLYVRACPVSRSAIVNPSETAQTFEPAFRVNLIREWKYARLLIPSSGSQWCLAWSQNIGAVSNGFTMALHSQQSSHSVLPHCRFAPVSPRQR